MENAPAYGTITIELYSNIAPKAVARFKELAKEGVYNGTTFHRVNASVIQGGDPNSKDEDPENDGMGSSNKPNVPAEFSDIPYDTGTVGAARAQDPGIPGQVRAERDRALGRPDQGERGERGLTLLRHRAALHRPRSLAT